MATDFFERQSEARRSTAWLVAMFVLAVFAITASTMAVAFIAVQQGRVHDAVQFHGQHDAWLESQQVVVPLAVGAFTLVLISGGTLVRVAQLSGGGRVVAESLEGRRVPTDSTDPVERRLLNVVEEMALASGAPVPPVYILDNEEAINAFAAGYSPSDAVVAVTRGSAEKLSRDELQGVIAHEFSHILNGDMRLNIRLIGLLYGILLLGLMGRTIVRVMGRSGGRRSRSSKNKGGGVLYFLLIGLALMIIGYLGTLIGNLIKAAVSRQREFLADASAVQFTRNPIGLAGALKRIGSATAGSKLKAPNAAEASHLYFAQGVWEGLTKLTATHPPLEERIRRLDPQWDGKFIAQAGQAEASIASDQRIAGLAGNAALEAESAEIPLRVVAQASDQVADPMEAHRAYAASVVNALPELVRQSVREPYGARAALFALLTDRRPDIRERQLQQLHQFAKPDVVVLTRKLLPLIDTLDVRARLPIVDLALPALRAMSSSQYKEFILCFQELVAADDKIGLFEWTLSQILLRHLRPQFEKSATPRPSYYALNRLGNECSVLLSALALADNRADHAAFALTKGAKFLPGVNVQLLDPAACGLSQLGGALTELARVAPKQRRQLVDACAATICADRQVSAAEAELLRGICDMLDCPMPPLLAGGPGVPLEIGGAA